MATAEQSVLKLRRLKAQPFSPPAPAHASALTAGKASVDQLKVIDDIASLSPSLASILRPQAAYRWLLPYLASITPQYVEGVLRGALAGNHVQAWELFDLMIDSDPEIAACVQEYFQGVTKKKFVFEPYRDEDEAPSPTAIEKCKVVSAAIRNMRPDPQNDENDIRGTVRDILFARFHGQSVLEIEYHAKGDDGELNVKDIPTLGQVLCPRSTYWVHPVCYAWSEIGRLGLRSAATDLLGQKKALKNFKGGRGGETELPLWNTVISQPRPSQLVDFPDNKFLIGVHKSKTGSVLGASCLRSLAWWWVASNFCGDWLLNYAQLFGIPFRKATYSSGTSQSVQVEIKQMLAAMGSAGYVLLPQGAELEFERAQGSAGESPQAFLFNFANDQKRKVILHQTMSGGSHSGGSKGTGKAFGSVEADTKKDCIDEGAMYVESVLNLQLVPYILNLNYGDGGDMEAPTIRLIDDDEGNLEDAQAIQIVAQLVDVGEDYMRKLFKVPKPGPKEKIAGQSTGSLAAAAQAQQDAADADREADLTKHKISTAASVKIAKSQPQGQPQGQPSQPGAAQQPEEEEESVEARNAAADALAKTVAPIAAELAKISKEKDPAARVEAMKAFLKKQPGLKAKLKSDPALAKAVREEAMKAFAQGLEEKPK